MGHQSSFWSMLVNFYCSSHFAVLCFYMRVYNPVFLFLFSSHNGRTQAYRKSFERLSSSYNFLWGLWKGASLGALERNYTSGIPSIAFIDYIMFVSIWNIAKEIVFLFVSFPFGTKDSMFFGFGIILNIYISDLN